MIDSNQLCCASCGRRLDGFPTFELRKHEANKKASIYLCYNLDCLVMGSVEFGIKISDAR